MSEQPKPLRILIVDDHAVVRTGLRAVLEDEEGLEVVGEAASAQESLAKVQALHPDVVLMDIRMGQGGDASGIDACRQIRSELPDTQVIMFTSYGERESVLSSVMAGATAFLTKNVGHAQLVEAIRAVGRGESILAPSVTRDVIQRLAELSRAPYGPEDVLSEREKEVMLLIAEGCTNKEIAARLFVSPYTARNHVIRILDKLGLSRRSEAAAQAVRLGLLREK
ncbi:MAG: response regulator transcription factor [Chloroflexota bacterium]|nr:response regulator transcription factor [Chloroflexota bacterium]